jgi:hypothetical protein
MAKERIWGTCSECFETVQCRKDSSGYTVLNHKDPDGNPCDGSGCEPDAVITENGDVETLHED